MDRDLHFSLANRDWAEGFGYTRRGTPPRQRIRLGPSRASARCLPRRVQRVVAKLRCAPSVVPVCVPYLAGDLWAQVLVPAGVLHGFVVGFHVQLAAAGQEIADPSFRVEIAVLDVVVDRVMEIQVNRVLQVDPLNPEVAVAKTLVLGWFDAVDSNVMHLTM